jgi:transketolase
MDQGSGDFRDLQSIAATVRMDALRSICSAGSGHPGGSLSCVEILVHLYFARMRIRPDEPEWSGRDRFVLSKGHACPALYAVLARRGYFDPAELSTLRAPGSRLQGHPDMRLLPGLDCSTGSLGQGFSVAAGLARGLACGPASQPSCPRVYCLLGDGELQEGCIWETAATAAAARLSNLVAVVDCNGLQLEGPIDGIKPVGSLSRRWLEFGWHPLEADGHSFGSLEAALDEACSCGLPSVVLARTVKGKGVSFMEGIAEWHGRCPGPEELRDALRELEKGLRWP